MASLLLAQTAPVFTLDMFVVLGLIAVVLVLFITEVIPIDIHVPGCPPRPEALVYGVVKLQERVANGEAAPVTVKPYELEEFSDLERDELVDKLADQIDDDELVMRYNFADSP